MVLFDNLNISSYNPICNTNISDLIHGTHVRRLILDLKDEEHKFLKIAAAQYEVPMKTFAIAAIRYYVDALKERRVIKPTSDKGKPSA
jgi:hypothetical protein